MYNIVISNIEYRNCVCLCRLCFVVNLSKIKLTMVSYEQTGLRKKTIIVV
jgi:hypothetical protein